MKSNSTWTDALLASFEDLTPSVREFRLRPEGGVLPYAPGSHLQLEVLIKGHLHMRSYSLVGEPDG